SDYGYYLQLIAGFGWSSLPWLRLLAQPTLVMAGAAGPPLPVAHCRLFGEVVSCRRPRAVHEGHPFFCYNTKKFARVSLWFFKRTINALKDSRMVHVIEQFAWRKNQGVLSRPRGATPFGRSPRRVLRRDNAKSRKARNFTGMKRLGEYTKLTGSGGGWKSCS